MANDDYNYLVFRILTHMYGIFKRKFLFEDAVFQKWIVSSEVPEEYLWDVLRYMQDEGLIAGLVFVRAWGNEYVLASDPADMRITPAGIRYLLDNDTMQKIKEKVLAGTPGALLALVKRVF